MNINDFPFVGEICEEYKERRRKGYSPVEVVEYLKNLYSNEAIDIDDGPQFWLGIAKAQIDWKELTSVFKDIISQSVSIMKGDRYKLNHKQVMKILNQLNDKNYYREPVRRKPVKEKKYLNLQEGDLWGRRFTKEQLFGLLGAPVTLYIHVIGHEKIGHTLYPIVIIKADVSGMTPSFDNYLNSKIIRSVYPDYSSRNNKDRYIWEFRSVIVAGTSSQKENTDALQQWIFLGCKDTEDGFDSIDPPCTYSWCEMQNIPVKAAESIIKKGLYYFDDSQIKCHRIIKETAYMGLQKGDMFACKKNNMKDIVLYIASFTESCDNVKYPVIMVGVNNGNNPIEWIRTAPDPDGYFMRNDPEGALSRMNSNYIIIGKGSFESEESARKVFSNEWSFLKNDMLVLTPMTECLEFWKGNIYEKSVNDLVPYIERCVQTYFQDFAG